MIIFFYFDINTLKSSNILKNINLIIFQVKQIKKTTIVTKKTHG